MSRLAQRWAEAITRSQCRSRSGVTPSNARAPSNTTEPSQAAWLIGQAQANAVALEGEAKSPTLRWLDEIARAASR